MYFKKKTLSNEDLNIILTTKFLKSLLESENIPTMLNPNLLCY